MKDVELNVRKGYSKVRGARKERIRKRVFSQLSVQSFNMGCSFLFFTMIPVLITCKGVQVRLSNKYLLYIRLNSLRSEYRGAPSLEGRKKGGVWDWVGWKVGGEKGEGRIKGTKLGKNVGLTLP
jgi:hypothetical protein